MKKLFYKIEMRIGNAFVDEETGEITGENFYYSDGNCIIEDGKILGYFTNDLFKAVFDEQIFAMSMILYDYYQDEDGQLIKESSDEYTFKANLNRKMEFPSQLVFVCKEEEFDENFLITLNFLSKVTDITKQKEIYDDLVEVGLI